MKKTQRLLNRVLFAVPVLAAGFLIAPQMSTPAHADPIYDKPISRGEVVARGFYWFFQNVPYSQAAYYPDPDDTGPSNGGYRTDCSGFVSMAWHLGTSRTTATLDDVSHVISRDSLKPGDILLRRDSSVQHVVLFVSWTDSSHTHANILSEASTADDMNYNEGAPISRWSTYTPRRYNRIIDDAYTATNETGPQNEAGATCNSSKPADPTIDLADRRDVYIEVRTCVRRQYLSATKNYQYHAWITLKWEPGRDSDDSSSTSKKRFDGFLVHTQIQHRNQTVKEVYCYLDNNINASYSGVVSCKTSYTTTNADGQWQADGFVNWNRDGDGKHWQKPFYVLGSANV